MNQRFSLLLFGFEGIVFIGVKKGNSASRDDDARKTFGGTQPHQIFKRNESYIIIVFPHSLMSQIRRSLLFLMNIFEKLNLESVVYSNETTVRYIDSSAFSW